MPDDDSSSRPPLRYRSLITLASWLVPGHARPGWRKKWESVLWSAWVLAERGELDPGMLRRCVRDCIGDVIYSRFTQREWRQYVRSPRIILTSLLAALALVAVCSLGFRGTRKLFQPLPVANPDQLVLIRYTGSAGQPVGIPPRVLPAWGSKSSPLSGIAAYWRRPFSPQVRVTTNFFSLLGAKAAEGRLLQPGDHDVAVLSESARRAMFGRHGNALGQHLVLDGRQFTVIGVLPETFWAISPRVEIWMPLELDPPDSSMPFLIPAIGRLKTNNPLQLVRFDLLRVAKAMGQGLPRPPEILQFTAVVSPQLFNYLAGVSFAVLVGAVMVARQQPFSLRHGWVYWRFLAAKTILLVGIPALAWVEVSSVVRGPGPPGNIWIALLDDLIVLVFLASMAFGFWWSFADQRRRCPQCLGLLAMPVTIGSWASVLEPVSTEFLCESGHGSLQVPETEQGEPDRWTALDPSWRELFDKVTLEEQ